MEPPVTGQIISLDVKIRCNYYVIARSWGYVSVFENYKLSRGNHQSSHMTLILHSSKSHLEEPEQYSRTQFRITIQGDSTLHYVYRE